jgi:uncharacterized protein YdeI (YjbR/CyaY-like superfamily)
MSTSKNHQKSKFFATPALWRRWLSTNHARADELWVGYYKRGSGKPSITWPESVDEALCYGWIDGLRRSIDAESYAIRFTPRRRGSSWSSVNVRRVAALTKAGLMRPCGSRAFQARKADKTAVYSFEQRKAVKLPRADERRLRAEPAAWRFFKAQAPWYQRTAIWWVISAKREETRQRRLDTLIADSARGLRIAPVRALDKKTK